MPTATGSHADSPVAKMPVIARAMEDIVVVIVVFFSLFRKEPEMCKGSRIFFPNLSIFFFSIEKKQKKTEAAGGLPFFASFIVYSTIE